MDFLTDVKDCHNNSDNLTKSSQEIWYISAYCVGSSFEEACSREYDKNSKKMTKDPAWRLLNNNKIYKIV